MEETHTDFTSEYCSSPYSDLKKKKILSQNEEHQSNNENFKESYLSSKVQFFP